MLKLTAKQKDALKWRIWNTFKSLMIVIVPVGLVVVYAELQSTPNELDSLITWELWESVIYAMLIALMGSLVAGIDKVQRMK